MRASSRDKTRLTRDINAAVFMWFFYLRLEEPVHSPGNRVGLNLKCHQKLNLGLVNI